MTEKKPKYYTEGTTGRFLGFFSVMVYAAFSVAGPDLPALAAGHAGCR
jgi:amino acid transporter